MFNAIAIIGSRFREPANNLLSLDKRYISGRGREIMRKQFQYLHSEERALVVSGPLAYLENLAVATFPDHFAQLEILRPEPLAVDIVLTYRHRLHRVRVAVWARDVRREKIEKIFRQHGYAWEARGDRVRNTRASLLTLRSHSHPAQRRTPPTERKQMHNVRHDSRALRRARFAHTCNALPRRSRWRPRTRPPMSRPSAAGPCPVTRCRRSPTSSWQVRDHESPSAALPRALNTSDDPDDAWLSAHQSPVLVIVQHTGRVTTGRLCAAALRRLAWSLVNAKWSAVRRGAADSDSENGLVATTPAEVGGMDYGFIPIGVMRHGSHAVLLPDCGRAATLNKIIIFLRSEYARFVPKWSGTTILWESGVLPEM